MMIIFVFFGTARSAWVNKLGPVKKLHYFRTCVEMYLPTILANYEKLHYIIL